jgi:trehalose-6-phosphate synthase
MRMHRMRKDIKEHNIYRWAGNLITELCEMSLGRPENVDRKISRQRFDRMIHVACMVLEQEREGHGFSRAAQSQ